MTPRLFPERRYPEHGFPESRISRFRELNLLDLPLWQASASYIALCPSGFISKLVARHSLEIVAGDELKGANRAVSSPQVNERVLGVRREHLEALLDGVRQRPRYDGPESGGKTRSHR